MTQFLYILEEILTLREYYLQKEEYCEYWLPYMWEPIFFTEILHTHVVNKVFQ